MRIKIKFTNNTTPVPVNNQHLLNGYNHKCLGKENGYHDTWSDYSISSLLGGKLNADGKTISFNNSAYILVSSKNSEFVNDFMMGALSNHDLFHGMKFDGVDCIVEEFYEKENHFVTLSPFIIREDSEEHGKRYITLKDADFETKVKDHLIAKLLKIDSKLDLKKFDVSIPERKWHKTKRITVGKSFCFANHCQVSVKCNKRVAEILYNVGIGKSTGSGFGTIGKTESKKLYFKK